MPMDPYQILGVDRRATPDQVKKAYRKLASQHHPDKGGDTQRFQEIQAAYDQIISGQADQPRQFHWGRNSPDFQDMQDILRRNFHDFDNMHAGAVRNPDVTVRVSCTLEEAHSGFSRNIQFLLPKQGSRNKTIEFPPGSYHGIRIRHAGDGGQLVPAMPPGDLYCELEVLPHKFWQPNFKTQELELNLAITLKEALVGTDIIITDINGSDIRVTVPAGSQPGSRLRLKGRGLQKFRQSWVGDAYIRLQVSIPKLTEDDLKKPLIDLL